MGVCGGHTVSRPPGEAGGGAAHYDVTFMT